MESTPEQRAVFILHETRELIRRLNEEHFEKTGHVMYVAITFDRKGEPLEYQKWEEHQAARQKADD